MRLIPKSKKSAKHVDIYLRVDNSPVYTSQFHSVAIFVNDEATLGAQGKSVYVYYIVQILCDFRCAQILCLDSTAQHERKHYGEDTFHKGSSHFTRYITGGKLFLGWIDMVVLEERSWVGSIV